MIVVDTNTIAYLYLTSPWSTQSEQVFLKDPDWAAPLLWRSEFCNVLALYIRKKLLSLEEALWIMEEATNLILGREYTVAPSQILSLASVSKCSAYDCEFISLAKELDVPLVTTDKQILEQFPDVAMALEKFAP